MSQKLTSDERSGRKTIPRYKIQGNNTKIIQRKNGKEIRMLVKMVKWREDGYYNMCGNRRGKQTEIDYEIVSEFLHISMQLTT